MVLDSSIKQTANAELAHPIEEQLGDKLERLSFALLNCTLKLTLMKIKSLGRGSKQQTCGRWKCLSPSTL